MVILMVLFVAAWIAAMVLGQDNHLDSRPESSQTPSWNLPALQPIAIPVRNDRSSSRN